MNTMDGVNGIDEAAPRSELEITETRQIAGKRKRDGTIDGRSLVARRPRVNIIKQESVAVRGPFRRTVRKPLFALSARNWVKSDGQNLR